MNRPPLVFREADAHQDVNFSGEFQRDEQRAV